MYGAQLVVTRRAWYTWAMKLDGYVRVSQVAGRSGDSFISPDVQREQIARWASLRGVTIAAWHEDLDQSGGKLTRPGLDAMMARLRAGETDGIAVARLDRLSRANVGAALRLVEEVTELGGKLAVVDLGVDPTTTFGEFALTIMLALARMERRRLMESWRIAQARAVGRGVQMGQVAYGYSRADDGRLVLDERAAPLMAEAFRQAGRGGARAATDYLAAHAPERNWQVNHVRKLLSRRVYLGELRFGSHRNDGAHPALVSLAAWEAAQHEPDGRRRPSLAYPLSGLAVCGSCGSPMVGSRGGDNSRRVYRCSQSVRRGRGSCPAPASTSAVALEEYVVAELRRSYSAPTFQLGDADLLAEAEATMREAEDELETFALDATARRVLGADAWERALSARASVRDEARETFRELARSASSGTVALTDEDWTGLEPDELGELLRAALARVEVAKGRRGVLELERRVRLVPKGHDDGLVPPGQDA